MEMRLCASRGLEHLGLPHLIEIIVQLNILEMDLIFFLLSLEMEKRRVRQRQCEYIMVKQEIIDRATQVRSCKEFLP